MAKEKTKKTKIPTAKKRMLQNEKQSLINQAFKSRVRTAIRRFKETLVNDEATQSQENLNAVYSLMDKGTKINVYKKNKANRVKSKLTYLLQSKSINKKKVSN